MQKWSVERFRNTESVENIHNINHEYSSNKTGRTHLTGHFRPYRLLPRLCRIVSAIFTKHFQRMLYVFDLCVTVHHTWKWRDVPTWCNNYDLLS